MLIAGKRSRSSSSLGSSGSAESIMLRHFKGSGDCASSSIVCGAEIYLGSSQFGHEEIAHVTDHQCICVEEDSSHMRNSVDIRIQGAFCGSSADSRSALVFHAPTIDDFSAKTGGSFPFSSSGASPFLSIEGDRGHSSTFPAGDEEPLREDIDDMQMFVATGEDASQEEIDDLRGPYKIQEILPQVVHRWSLGAVSPISPDKFLRKLLDSRGYDTHFIPSVDLRQRRVPTQKQIDDYDNVMVGAIRNSDLNQVKTLFLQGRSMSACNRFSESIVHMACRRSELDVVDFVLRNGGDVNLVDDYGRTPLHDACWRPEPRFDVVTMLMDRNKDLIRLQDVRGSTPLNYVREEHWLEWCAFIFHQKERFWSKK